MDKLPHPSTSQFNQFFEELQAISSLKQSTLKIDLISEAGDSTGSPYNHWRWKRKILPDVVVWPDSISQIKPIIELAKKYMIPIVTRGGGTCYYGSSVPGIGGIIVDMKRCNNYRIDKRKQQVICEGGVGFSSIMEDLEEHKFELAGYPSSARSSTIAGWISTGAMAGYGTINGPRFIDSIQKITFIDGNAKEQILDTPEIIKHFCGSLGILGIITEITLKIFPMTKKFPFIHYVHDSTQLFSAVENLIDNDDLFFLRFGNVLNKPSSPSLHLFSVYSIHNSIAIEYMNRQPSLDAENAWATRFEFETKFKQDYPTLFIQQIWVHFDTLSHILDYYKSLCTKYNHQSYWYAMLGKNYMIRLVLLIPTDPANWLHFMVAKAIGHFTVLQAYQYHENRIYIYGLQNTPYLHHFEKEKLQSWKKWKSKRDPLNLFNPLKLTTTRVSVFRLSVMFKVNLILSRFQRLFQLLQKK